MREERVYLVHAADHHPRVDGDAGIRHRSDHPFDVGAVGAGAEAEAVVERIVRRQRVDAKPVCAERGGKINIRTF